MTTTDNISQWSLLIIWSAFLAMCLDALAGVTAFPWTLYVIALAAGFIGLMVNALKMMATV